TGPVFVGQDPNTGNGGTITLTSNSDTAFVVGGAGATVNGITGTLTANGSIEKAKGGTITIENKGSGGISLNAATDILAEGSLLGGDGGHVTINAPKPAVTLGRGPIFADPDRRPDTPG